MFKAKGPILSPNTDFTKNLKEISFYRYGHLRSLGLTGDITALAADPILSLFAVGTTSGNVHVYGQPAFQFTLPVSGASSAAPASPIKFLMFHPGHHRIVAVDESNTIHSFSLQHITDQPNPSTHPPLPTREGAYSMYGTITAADQPLPSATHMFFSMKDGATLAWDLSRHCIGALKIGNCWVEYEERMVRSGIPGRRRTLGGPMPTCLAICPRDINIMLIGYEGGIVAYDFRQAMPVKTFEMTLPPGAPGGGTYDDANSLWTERTPTVTSVAWRADGLVFVVGHSDGCMAFWAYTESDKPLTVRTITHEDVNVIDAESLYSAGALDNQIRKPNDVMTANREPVFKLAWVHFPDQAELKLLVATAGVDGTSQPISNATHDYVERGETLLVVLGGQSAGEKPGINILQFPAYTPPLAKKGPQSPSQALPAQERYAYRDSLMPTGTSYYPTPTPPEDFILMPRSNPYFNNCHDPTAIIVTLTPDSSVSKTNKPTAERGIEAWSFPPPRSTVAPPSPGRKSFAVPGEDDKLVAMTPAPMMSSNPASPRSPSPSAGWRLPWTASPSSRVGSPTLRVPGSPDSAAGSAMSPFGPKRIRNRRRYRVPSSLWTGSSSVLGCQVYSLSTANFKRLISYSIEVAGQEDEPRLPLYGGAAAPDLQSHGAPDVKVSKLESYRILATYHADATVRFWDVSPHLLLLPTPLRFEYPGPLPHLTISIPEYLKGLDVAHLPLAKLWETDKSAVRIKSVHLAREALECVITMVTGEVIVTKFGESKKSARDELEELDDSPADSYFPTNTGLPSAHKQEWIEEVTEIGHLAKWKHDGFKPVAIFTLKRGEAIACAVSDIGFIAVSFASTSVAIIDMRGPDIILREGFNEDGVMVKKRKKKGNVQNVPAENSVADALRWVVSGMGTDASPKPRLIVSYTKGMTKIYTLANVLGEWLVETKPPTFTNESLSNPIASFVIDPLTGNELLPTAESLSASMRPVMGDEKSKDAHCLWIAASRKSIRCAINFNGERVAKVELEVDELSDVFYVTRHGNKIIVAITTTGDAIFYSVPFLEQITRVHLYAGMDPRPVGRVSFDDKSGDFVEYAGPLDVNLRTIFYFRKPLPPRIEPCSLKRPIPYQPTPVTASTLAWMWGGAPLTGAQLDAIAAGPNRPALPRPPPVPRQPWISWGGPPDEPVKPTTPDPVKRTTIAKQKAPARDLREREDAYTEMRLATEERGSYIDQLGEQMNNASVSASNYLTQARNNALKESAKASAKGVLSKLF